MTLSDYYVRDRSPLSIGGLAVYSFDPALEKRMAATDRFGEAFNMSRRFGDKIGIPRGLALRPAAEDLRTDGDPVSIHLREGNKPRSEEQARIVIESYNHLQDGACHILSASTGFGKCYCALTLAGMLSRKTLVVVTKEDLLQQWRRDALQFLDLKDEEIGVIQQDQCEVEGKKLVIGMMQSLMKEKYPTWIYAAFGLVVFDEVHHLSAEKFSIVAGLFHANLRLGLTATPKRVDGKEFVFEAHIGPVLVSTRFIPVPPKVLVIQSPWKVPMVPRRVNGYWKTVPLPHEHGKLGAILKYIAQCDERNRMIVQAARLAWEKKRYVLVLSDLARELHLNRLHQLAVEKGIPESDIGFYVGGMKEEDLEKSKTKHLVLGTYAMCGEATDVPWWDTCILATPRSNIRQAVGRILRPYPDKLRPLVFDFLDGSSQVLVDYYRHRCKEYEGGELRGEVVTAHL